jgi:hypothetical protein
MRPRQAAVDARGVGFGAGRAFDLPIMLAHLQWQMG